MRKFNLLLLGFWGFGVLGFWVPGFGFFVFILVGRVFLASRWFGFDSVFL